MGRRKKIKTEEVVEKSAPTEKRTITNDAVFTEYPSFQEQLVEVKVETKKPKIASLVEKPLESFQKLAVAISEELKAIDSELKVVQTDQFGKMIRILGNNGLHCFSRVREAGPNSYVGEFLSFIPVQHLKTITAIYTKLGVSNKGGTYLAISGLA